MLGSEWGAQDKKINSVLWEYLHLTSQKDTFCYIQRILTHQLGKDQHANVRYGGASDFPGDLVAKASPSNAGAVGSIPGQGPCAVREGTPA